MERRPSLEGVVASRLVIDPERSEYLYVSYMFALGTGTECGAVTDICLPP
jgi:hypothetical protein